MSVSTVQGTLTPWNIYDTNSNPFDNAIYQLMNQVGIASNQVDNYAVSLQTATATINQNNIQLAMLNEPWNTQTLIPWPTDPAAASALTQTLITDGIIPPGSTSVFDSYQYVGSDGTTSYAQPVDPSPPLAAGVSQVPASLAGYPIGSTFNARNANGSTSVVMLVNAASPTLVSATPVAGSGFVLNPTLTELQTWNAAYASMTPPLPTTWPTDLASTDLIDAACNGQSIFAITGNAASGGVSNDAKAINNQLNLLYGFSILGQQGEVPWNGDNSFSVSQLASNISQYGGDDYFVTTQPGSAVQDGQFGELDAIQYGLMSDDGLLNGPYWTANLANADILPTATDATQIANNMQSLANQGVVTNTVQAFDAYGVATNPPNPVNSGVLAKLGGVVPSLWTSPELADAENDNRILTNPASDSWQKTLIPGTPHNYVPNSTVITSSSVQSDQFAAFTSTGIPIADTNLQAGNFVRNPDGSYGCMVEANPPDGKLYELVLTGLIWNPSAQSSSSWNTQASAKIALAKTLELQNSTVNGANALSSSDYDSVSVTYYNSSDSQTLSTINVLDSEVVTTPPTPGLQGQFVGGVQVKVTVYKDPAGNYHVYTPFNGPNGASAQSVTPFVGNPSATVIGQIQSFFVNQNSNLSNTAQNTQLQLQAYYATITSACQAVATIIASLVSERQAIDGAI